MKTALLALLVLSLLSIPFAHATTPTTVTGTFTASFTVLSVTSSDGNTIIAVTEIATLSGFFTGTRIAQGSEVIHPDGTFNAHDTGIFTGTANGVAGTLVITGASDKAPLDYRAFTLRDRSSSLQPAPPALRVPIQYNSTRTPKRTA